MKELDLPALGAAYEIRVRNKRGAIATALITQEEAAAARDLNGFVELIVRDLLKRVGD